MKEKLNYTAPAVIASMGAIQNTKALIVTPSDSDPDAGNDGAPGSVGFFV